MLGSSGSVVPIFRRQIAAGGPVTVTDARMTRYFMTIPEAVQLIIRAGSLEEPSGEIFVLEMGEPMRIIELARQMIRLSGCEPERDIAIDDVGARRGEKFHEDLFNTRRDPSRPRRSGSCAPPRPAGSRLGEAHLRRDRPARARGRRGRRSPKHVSMLSRGRVTRTEGDLDPTAALDPTGGDGAPLAP